MPKPSVTTNVVDRTTRVNSVGTYNAAIVIAAKKGPINEPTLVTSQTDFLRRFTPNETIELGWDGAHHEAFQYLATQSNLYVVRAAHTSDLADRDDDSIALFGGCNIMLYKSEKESAPLEQGFADINTIDFDYANVACLIYGANEGAYNNDIAISIVTDPEIVKLDGCFIIRVYKKDRNTKAYVKVEEWTCSLDPTLKNGYGVNCYVQDVLKGSNYIRAIANDLDDAIMDSSYTLTVDGSVKFENTVIATTKVRESNKSYNAGDIILCNELSTAKAYYTCSIAGRAAATAPAFSENNKYLETVIDNKCTWTLTEIVKPYATETQFDARDIVTVTDGTTSYAYRVLGEGGTTGDEAPVWGEDVVYDGQITWARQDQTVDVLDATGYIGIEGVKDQVIDPAEYTIYKDVYLTTKMTFAEKVSVTDPTQMVQDVYGNWVPLVVEKAPTYTAKYTGEELPEHIVLPKPTEDLVKLAGGHDGSEATVGDRIKALNTMKNRKKYKVSLVMDGGCSTPEYQMAINTFCESRSQDCHGICSVPINAQMVDDNGASVVNYRNTELNANTTNLELYVPHQLIYDQFNDKNIYISPSCFAAARIMDVATTLGWHWIPAGYNRGIVNSLDVFKDYDDTVVGTFSDAQINTICREQGVGNVIMDDLTMMNKACDLQDAHISRFVNIELRPQLEDALKNFLFEFNDAETRNTIVKMLENFMRPKVANRAVQNFRIVCDESNNLPNDIQNNICNVWIYVIPTKGIKWLRADVILTSQGAEMGEFTETA